MGNLWFLSASCFPLSCVPEIPDHSNRILVMEALDLKKTNALLSVIKKQNNDDYSINDKKFIYVLRIQMNQNINILLKTRKNGLENLKDPKAFIECSNNMQISIKILKVQPRQISLLSSGKIGTCGYFTGKEYYLPIKVKL